MLTRLILMSALAVGIATPIVAWAQNGRYPPSPPVGARVVYLDAAPRAGGFLRCRLTPTYRWLCDDWSGPGYVFSGNVVSCY